MKIFISHFEPPKRGQPLYKGQDAWSLGVLNTVIPLYMLTMFMLTGYIAICLYREYFFTLEMLKILTFVYMWCYLLTRVCRRRVTVIVLFVCLLPGNLWEYSWKYSVFVWSIYYFVQLLQNHFKQWEVVFVAFLVNHHIEIISVRPSFDWLLFSLTLQNERRIDNHDTTHCVLYLYVY